MQRPIRDPNDPLNSAHLLMKQHEYKKAIGILITLKPSFSVLSLLTSAYLDTDEYELAKNNLSKLESYCKTAKHLEDYHYAYARCYWGLYKKTKEQKYLADFEKVLPTLKKYKGNPHIEIKVILYYIDVNPNHALELIEEYMHHFQNNVHAITVAQKLKMNIYSQQGRLEDAKHIAKNIANNTPDGLKVSVTKAISQIDRTLAPETIDFERDFALRKDKPLSLSNMALALEQTGRLDEAEKVYKYCIENFKHHWYIHLQYAFMLQQSGDYQNSLPPLLDIIKEAQNSDRAIRPTKENLLNTYKSLAIAYYNLKDFLKAKSYLEPGLEIEPNNAVLKSLQAKMSAPLQAARLYNQAMNDNRDRFDRLHSGVRQADTKVLLVKSDNNQTIPTPQPKPTFAATDFPLLPSKSSNVVTADEADSIIRINLKPLKQAQDLAKAVNKRKLKQKQEPSYYKNACTLFAVAGTVICAGLSLYVAKTKLN